MKTFLNSPANLSLTLLHFCMWVDFVNAKSDYDSSEVVFDTRQTPNPYHTPTIFLTIPQLASIVASPVVVQAIVHVANVNVTLISITNGCSLTAFHSNVI